MTDYLHFLDRIYRMEKPVPGAGDWVSVKAFPIPDPFYYPAGIFLKILILRMPGF